jgi:hypothetical protein
VLVGGREHDHEATRGRRQVPLVSLVPLAVWAVWQALLVATGARFSTALLDISWQLVPIETLRHDPIGSVWYLHIQPPLWNFAVGAVTRWSPLPDALSLQVLLLACSALVVVLVADLLRLMRFRPWICMATASVVALDPELVRYAYESAYELPCTMLVLLTVWTGVRLVERPSARTAVALSGAATALVLTRSLFHPAALLLLLVVLLVAVRHRLDLSAVVLCLVVPLALVGGWLVKNEVLFGEATTSSWSGMNLQRAVIPPLAADQLEQLQAEGVVSAVAAIGPFKSYADYAAVMPPCRPKHHHPAVDEPARANGVPNFNDECYLPVFRQAGKDAWAVARHRPAAWWRGRVWAARATFVEGKGSAPTASAPFRASQSLYRALTLARSGALSWDGWGQPIFGTAPIAVRYLFVLVAGLVTLVARAAVGLVRLLRRRGDRVIDGAWLLAASITLYTLVVGIVAELGEQFRFRPIVEPLLVGLPLALLLSAVDRRLRSRRASPPAVVDSMGMPTPVAARADDVGDRRRTTAG